jgi:cytoskeletal protein CcmA (bactofilin family)
MSAPSNTTEPADLDALLGPGTRFEGTLAFEGRVRLEGALRGRIVGDDILVVGPSAHVEADLEVGTLILLGGKIEGRVVARDLVELHAPGTMIGDIVTPKLFVDPGVTFEGRCTMPSGAEPEVTRLGVEEPRTTTDISS